MLASRMRTASDGISGERSLELNRLDRLDNPGLRIPHHVSAFAIPHPAHFGEKPLSVLNAVELEVDHHVVWIVDRPQDLISTNARTSAVGRIAVESALPTGEVGNCMFDTENGHSWLLIGSLTDLANLHSTRSHNV